MRPGGTVRNGTEACAGGSKGSVARRRVDTHGSGRGRRCTVRRRCLGREQRLEELVLARDELLLPPELCLMPKGRRQRGEDTHEGTSEEARQREHVRGSTSEGARQREHVRGSTSEGGTSEGARQRERSGPPLRALDPPPPPWALAAPAKRRQQGI